MDHTESCHVEFLHVTPEREELERARSSLLSIAGLGCPNCVNRVRNAILKTPGVVQVQLELPDHVARIWYDEALAGIEDLVHAVARAGDGTHHTYLAVPLEPWVADDARRPQAS